MGDGSDAVTLADYINAAVRSRPLVADVEWLRSIWDGPIVIKGIQTVADARIAADEGVEAIALSNHGGRQLDAAPAPSSISSRRCADAVGDRIEIICDGGVRRGSDIVKAVALGARACMAGRAYLYGLGAAGERGVDHVLDCSTPTSAAPWRSSAPHDRRPRATRHPSLKARERAKFANRQRQLLCCRFSEFTQSG